MFIAPRKEYALLLKTGTLPLGKRTLVMGILNVTPDSFSDGGKYADFKKAVAHALQMQKDGVDIIDVGGESTRPGAQSVSVQAELDRVLPVIKGIAETSAIPISIDTSKAAVAAAALEAGASIVNDVTAFQADPGMPAILVETGAPVLLMHMKGTPRTMQQNPTYDDVVGEISRFLRQAIEKLPLDFRGVQGAPPPEPASLCELRTPTSELGTADCRLRTPNSELRTSSRVLIDPGIGFGKTTAHNLEILARLNEFAVLNYPLVVGASRKSFIGNVLNLPVGERLEGTAASVAAAILGGAHIVRVHDVLQMRRVADICDAVRASGHDV